MRYMLMRKADPVTEAGELPGQGVLEAMADYNNRMLEAEVTGGRLEALIAYGETPAARETPSERHDRIIHASLNIRGRRLMGADMAGDGYQPPQGAQVHFDYETLDRAEAVFNRLAEGGEVTMPFGATFWAQGVGMLTDRFGVPWMIGCQTGQCPMSEEESQP